MNSQDFESFLNHQMGKPEGEPWAAQPPHQNLLCCIDVLSQGGWGLAGLDQYGDSSHQILEHLGAAVGLIQLLDHDTWEYRYLSPAYEAVFGYPVAEFLLSNLWMSRIDPDDRSSELAHLYERVTQGTAFTAEYRFYDPQDGVRWISTNFSPFWNQSAGCWMVALLSLEISRHKQAELELWRSQQVLKTVIDSVPYSIFWKDFNSVYLGCNQTFARGAGLDSSSTIVGKMDDELPWTPEETDWYRACDRRIMDSNQPEFHFSETQLQANGQHLQLETSKVPLHDAKGNVIGILGIFEDVSDRKRAEEVLHLQGAALEAAANSIVITDLQGIIQWVNPAFTELTGYSLAESLGKNPRQLLKSGQHSADLYQDLWSTILSGQVWKGEMVNRRKDGSLYTEEMTITPVRNSHREVTHFIAIKQDVSDRKAAEETLRYLNQKLEQLASLDSLTQTANRRQFDSRFEEEWQRLSREQHLLSLILLDIDYFKRYNDYFGHPQGDQCLIQIAQALKESVLRPSDLVARYGGEEFVILLPNTHLQGAVRVARRIRSGIQRLNLPHPASSVSRMVTVSCGVGSLKLPSEVTTPSAFLASVDHALYEAKRTRNCYCVRMEKSSGMETDSFLRIK